MDRPDPTGPTNQPPRARPPSRSCAPSPGSRRAAARSFIPARHQIPAAILAGPSIQRTHAQNPGSFLYLAFLTSRGPHYATPKPPASPRATSASPLLARSSTPPRTCCSAAPQPRRATEITSPRRQEPLRSLFLRPRPLQRPFRVQRRSPPPELDAYDSTRHPDQIQTLGENLHVFPFLLALVFGSYSPGRPRTAARRRVSPRPPAVAGARAAPDLPVPR